MILDINKISIYYRNHYEESIREIVKEADMILKDRALEFYILKYLKVLRELNNKRD